MRPVFTLAVATLVFMVCVGVLADELGVRAAGAFGVGSVAVVVAGVAVMLVEWGGSRGKTD